MKRNVQTVMQRRAGRIGILLCVPALIIVFFSLYSVGYAFVSSFNSNKGFMSGKYEFVGLANYLKILTSREVWSVAGNTAFYVIATIGIELSLGLIVSAAIRRDLPGTKIAKVGILFPMMMAPVASGAIWQWMLTDRYGVVNYFLGLLGIEGPSWLGMPWPARWAVVIVSIWGAAPFVILVLIAAIGNIPEETLEAARIDGANDRQLYWNVIFPYLKPSIALILLIRIPDALRMYDLVYILTQGGPANATQVVSYYVYSRGFTSKKFAEASAAAFLLFIFIAIVTLLCNRLLKVRKH